MESEIASFSKFTVVWYTRATSLKLTVRTLLCLVVIQALFLTCASTGSLSDQFYQVSNAYRLWPVINSVQLRNVLHVTVSTLLNRKLEKRFPPMRIWHHRSVEISVCVTELCSRSTCHDESIILPLPWDLSARRTWLVVFHLLTGILKRNVEKIAVVRRVFLDHKPVGKCMARTEMYV